jgi:hypothetical protein
MRLHHRATVKSITSAIFPTIAVGVASTIAFADQPDKESRDDPNERGTFQDNWQSDEDISALDGMAI